jgi:hypothetical protein
LAVWGEKRVLGCLAYHVSGSKQLLAVVAMLLKTKFEALDVEGSAAETDLTIENRQADGGPSLVDPGSPSQIGLVQIRDNGRDDLRQVDRR